MQYLDEELAKLAKSDMYPFHMPGHKRNMRKQMDPYAYDITEIDHFDNLHAPDGIIKEAQERAAQLWGAEHSYFLVNGSTCGILAALSAAVAKRGHILMARNAHKAVYHAAYLRELDVTYVYPRLSSFGIQGSITPEQIEEALLQNQTIQAVVITSPTYDGVVSDIASIAKIAHAHHIPLIVDEAHGAHLSFCEYFPKSAISQGADVVIQSLHKTLPSFTQTAILHLKSDLVQPESIARFLGIYETSSPSYLFMAGIDRCVRLLSEEGTRYFDRYVNELTDFYNKTKRFHQVQVMQKDTLDPAVCFNFDPSKILIRVAGLSGKALYQLLRERYHLQMEMCQGEYVLAMTSIMDKEQGFRRLVRALSEIDHMAQKMEYFMEEDGKVSGNFMEQAYGIRQQGLSLSEAMDAKKALKPLEESVGSYSGEFVFLYPPGIPMLVPGERIDAAVVKILKECQRLKLNICGITEDNQINVVIS